MSVARPAFDAVRDELVTHTTGAPEQSKPCGNAACLRNLDVTTLLLAGVKADQCVLATLIDAACIGYDAVFLTDAAATTSPGFCWDATVYNVRQCFGFTARLADIASAAGGG